MSAELAGLGLVPFFLQQLSEDEQADCRLARVVEVQRTVVTASDGARSTELPFPGALRDARPEQRPTIGDWVLIDGSGERLVRVLERKSLLKRGAAGERADVQLIAANIDVLFVLTSCNEEFNESRLERYLALAAEAGVIPVIVLTKTDLAEDVASFVDRAHAIQRGVAVETIDARDPATLAGVRAWLTAGSTVALVGSSGVGKSSLANSLSGSEVMTTGGIREDDARGRHTTTHRSMWILPDGGILVDMPGMRELKVADLDSALGTVFDEIERAAQGCRFADCSHISEPGCAVREAVEAGRIDERRWQNYLKLAREDARNSQSLAERHARERQFGKVVKNLKALNKELGLK